MLVDDKMRKTIVNVEAESKKITLVNIFNNELLSNEFFCAKYPNIAIIKANKIEIFPQDL